MARPVDNTPAGVIARQAKLLAENAQRVRAFGTLGQPVDPATIDRLQESVDAIQRAVDALEAVRRL